MASNAKLGDLNLSQDEIKRFGDALKDEKFRELLIEYAEEIRNPENRRRYEEEITQLEREKGMDVTFITPEPGYVLKTSVNGKTKAFINISTNDKIEKPSSKRQHGPNGKSGLMWQIPHSFAPPREDYDKAKSKCQVFDFVVHPDTYRMAESNIRFKKMVEDTAIEGIEKKFGFELDKKNIKRPKMTFKGIPTATIVRNRNSTGPQNVPDASGILKDMPYPYDNKTSAEKAKEMEENVAKQKKKTKTVKSKQTSPNQKENGSKTGDVTVPNYTIIHRSDIDFQEFRNAPDARPSTRPKELVIKIELPLLNSASQANLDIFEKHLFLESVTPAAYRLDLPLPYPVNDSEGSARFDKQKRLLIVTLPVLPGEIPTMPTFFCNSKTESLEPQSNGDKIPNQKPLIEVITPVPDTKEEVCEKDSECKTRDVEEENRNKFNPQIAYILPEFTFTQDIDTVTFVLKVKNVEANSIVKMFPAANALQVFCLSRGSGGFPYHYSLYLKFVDSCCLASEYCSIDVTDDNMVLLLLKEKSARGFWNRFWAGLNLEKLEEHLFLTVANLQQQLTDLDSAAIAASTDSDFPPATPCELEVTTMNEKKLTIQISPPKAIFKEEEEENDDYEAPSSADIEVVHARPPPTLQGILKQHTVSESSEDVFLDLESPRSGADDEEDSLSSSLSSGKRRSVSFSEHIDQATFKSSASVTSMTTALKSKRRRQRKREEREKICGSRRRYNSTGSEGSGDDRSHDFHSLSDSHSHSEDDVGLEDISSPVQSSPFGVTVHGDGLKKSKVLDFRTKHMAKEKVEKSVGKNGKKAKNKNVNDAFIKSSSETVDHSGNFGIERNTSSNETGRDFLNETSGVKQNVDNLECVSHHNGSSGDDGEDNNFGDGEDNNDGDGEDNNDGDIEDKHDGDRRVIVGNKAGQDRSEEGGKNSEGNAGGFNRGDANIEAVHHNHDITKQKDCAKDNDGTQNELGIDNVENRKQNMADGYDVSGDVQKKITGDIKSNLVKKSKKNKDSDDDDDDDDDGDNDIDQDPYEKKRQLDIVAEIDNNNESPDGSKNNKDTNLSCKESRPDDNEHRTHCAFAFSNSVIFDLDAE